MCGRKEEPDQGEMPPVFLSKKRSGCPLLRTVVAWRHCP